MTTIVLSYFRNSAPGAEYDNDDNGDVHKERKRLTKMMMMVVIVKMMVMNMIMMGHCLMRMKLKLHQNHAYSYYD